MCCLCVPPLSPHDREYAVAVTLSPPFLCLKGTATRDGPRAWAAECFGNFLTLQRAPRADSAHTRGGAAPAAQAQEPRAAAGRGRHRGGLHGARRGGRPGDGVPDGRQPRRRGQGAARLAAPRDRRAVGEEEEGAADLGGYDVVVGLLNVGVHEVACLVIDQGCEAILSREVDV